jgi:hypothetical protein
LGPGDIALADVAYATPIIKTVQKQAEVSLQMSLAPLPVYDSDGQRVDLAQMGGAGEGAADASAQGRLFFLFVENLTAPVR